MKSWFVLILTLTGTHCKVLSGPDVVDGVVEQTVTIPCTYKRYSYSEKYWCKDIEQNCVTMASSTNGAVTDSRVSIRDDRVKGVFNVTIMSLVMEDKGWYQCGMYRSIGFEDHRHKIYLNVSTAARVPTAEGPQTASAAEPIIDDSSVAEVWPVMRWVLFSMMLACFFTVTWWQRNTARVKLNALHESNSTIPRV